MSACRSCGREILWAIVDRTGRRMPLDPNPRPDGNVRKLDRTDAETDAPLVEVLGKRTQVPLDEVIDGLYVSHFATCPHADQHRRR